MLPEAKIGRFTVAGQPTESDLSAFLERGFCAVVNLRMPGGRLAGERERVEALGIPYFEVPLLLETISSDHLAYIREALAASEAGEVFLH